MARMIGYKSYREVYVERSIGLKDHFGNPFVSIVSGFLIFSGTIDYVDFSYAQSCSMSEEEDWK